MSSNNKSDFYMSNKVIGPNDPSVSSSVRKNPINNNLDTDIYKDKKSEKMASIKAMKRRMMKG